MTYWAHAQEPLALHLRRVAERAAQFSRPFDAVESAAVAGLLHDLGKAEDNFQKRILGETAEKQPHAPHGAALLLGQDIWPAAFAVAGHHAGLRNRGDLQKLRGEIRLGQARAAARKLEGDAHWDTQPWPLQTYGPNLPPWLDPLPFSSPEERASKMRAVDLYTRFLFSALVDADRLATEEQDAATNGLTAKRGAWRFGEAGLGDPAAPDTLLAQLDTGIAARRREAESRGASAEVLAVRQQVLAACDRAANGPRGVFSLTVPTGGGKTLAAVHFALRHIQEQNRQQYDLARRLRRVIIVIPYLSIIQQSVAEFADVFAHSETDPVVLEHHSQAQDPELPAGRQAGEVDTDDYSRTRTLRQLAAENWDAPIVVTTSVQFFDSLFSRRPADCRKLHNIAQSVVIFDEVQTFPPRLMQPILDALAELTSPERPYGCSLVLCTATQPALQRSDDLPCGLSGVTPIIADPKPMFSSLARVTYPELLAPADIPVLGWNAIAERLDESPEGQALVVVNTRAQARTLFQAVHAALPETAFHLSTWMTSAHRTLVLDEVRQRLKDGKPCLLISTQCIEAGVDVDFPTVWRAIGPYDSIVQAAGRCNRNGRRKPADSIVHVFRPEDDVRPQGVYGTATSQTELLRRMGLARPDDPESFDTYFRLLYQLSVPDKCEIQEARENLRFEQVGELFNFIERTSLPVLILDESVDGKCRETPARAIYEAARVRHLPGTQDRGYFRATEWRRIQAYLVNLDTRNRKDAIALAKDGTRAFGSDALWLWIWEAGHGGYIGGLHGTGIVLDNPDVAGLIEGGV